jgi:hypothetical protein
VTWIRPAVENPALYGGTHGRDRKNGEEMRIEFPSLDSIKASFSCVCFKTVQDFSRGRISRCHLFHPKQVMKKIQTLNQNRPPKAVAPFRPRKATQSVGKNRPV